MIGLQRLTIEGKRFVVLPETEYEELCRQAGKALEADELPPLPQPDKNGRYRALEYGALSLAARPDSGAKSVGLSQQQLANLAGVRQETLSRIESGKHTATPQTIHKITKAIEGERKRHAQVEGWLTVGNLSGPEMSISKHGLTSLVLLENKTAIDSPPYS